MLSQVDLNGHRAAFLINYILDSGHGSNAGLFLSSFAAPRVRDQAAGSASEETYARGSVSGRVHGVILVARGGPIGNRPQVGNPPHKPAAHGAAPRALQCGGGRRRSRVSGKSGSSSGAGAGMGPGV